MLQDLQYFMGKVCTIATVQINFRFKEEQMMDYFMGIVERIDGHGIMISHPATHCKSYIFLEHIASISEEQVLYEDDPEHAKLIEQYKKEKPITADKRVVVPQSDSPYIDPEALAEMARLAQLRS